MKVINGEGDPERTVLCAGEVNCPDRGLSQVRLVTTNTSLRLLLLTNFGNRWEIVVTATMDARSTGSEIDVMF